MVTLHDLTALEQARRIAAGELASVALVEHYLDRIAQVDGMISSFVERTADRALSRAAEVDVAAERGAALGPLAGVPTAFKDLEATAGVPTKLGSLAFADNVPDHDDSVVARVERAGMVSLGKTATPELGGPAYTESRLGPPTCCPWDVRKNAGGSSGGTGAAIAAGLVPLGVGSDGGGSIRIPASINGIVGLKVARDRVSRGRGGADLVGLAQRGPMARTVADAAALLDVIAGAEPGDAHCAPGLPAGETFLAATRRAPARLRIGRTLGNIFDSPVHPDCVAAWERASQVLAGLGHDIVDIDLPVDEPLLPHFRIVWTSAFAAVDVPGDREHLLTPYTAMMRDAGRRHSAPDYVRAVAKLQIAARSYVQATNSFDVVLTPSLAQPPADNGELRNDRDPERDFLDQCAFTPFTSLYNLTGQPAISLPLHWDDAGLPIGVQLVGKPWGESPLLSLAAQVEEASPWADRHPPCWELSR